MSSTIGTTRGRGEKWVSENAVPGCMLLYTNNNIIHSTAYAAASFVFVGFQQTRGTTKPNIVKSCSVSTSTIIRPREADVLKVFMKDIQAYIRKDWTCR